MILLPVEPLFERGGPTPLAARFDAHLRAIRRALGLPTGVVTGRRPAPVELSGGGLVPVGHLVATIGGGDTVEDTVVWELLSPAAYRCWLAGAAVPDPAALAAALPGLLRLRALHRGGQLEAHGLAALAALLAGRYLSARIAHRHARLVLDAAARAAPAGIPGPPDARRQEPTP
jgi:hypothetical protein